MERARILLKIESENPTGSMKDRTALALIEAAERDGRLASGGSVVEYTGGSTGVSLALICAAKRYPLHEEIRERTGAFWTDQLRNADQLPAYPAMGDEIWHQTGGRIDAFVQSVGPPPRCAASPSCCATGVGRSTPSPSSRASPRCSRGVRPGCTGSRESARASWSRSGRPPYAQLGKGATVVTVMCDSGRKYLGTELDRGE